MQRTLRKEVSWLYLRNILEMMIKQVDKKIADCCMHEAEIIYGPCHSL